MGQAMQEVEDHTRIRYRTTSEVVRREKSVYAAPTAEKLATVPLTAFCAIYMYGRVYGRSCRPLQAAPECFRRQHRPYVDVQLQSCNAGQSSQAYRAEVSMERYLRRLLAFRGKRVESLAQ